MEPRTPGSVAVLRDAWLIAQKDLRIEWRSRVVTNQVAPFTLLILVLFGFALNANTETLRLATSGLFWFAVLFVAGLRPSSLRLRQ